MKLWQNTKTIHVVQALHAVSEYISVCKHVLQSAPLLFSLYSIRRVLAAYV